MQLVGVKNVDDKPSDEFLPSHLPNAGNAEKKAYLRKLAAEVVDNFVLRREKIETALDNLLNAMDEEARNRREQDESGRFICKFPGCDKTFAHNGKRLRDPEATHEPPVSVDDSENQQAVTGAVPPKSPEKDDMFNYQCSFLEYGMIILNFFDAVRCGDGRRIVRSWKFQLPYLRKDPGSTKYALEALGLLFQVNALLSPKDAHSLIWNRSALVSGHNIPLDLVLEFYNRMLKEVKRNLGPNATNTKAIDRYCHAINLTKTVLDNFDHECGVIRRSGRHYEMAATSDLRKVVTELMCQNAFCWTPGRSYGHFTDFDSSLLDGFDLNDMFRWINDHKKNIVKARRAR